MGRRSFDHVILVGDVRETLKTIPDGSVHCVVTSPPYWGLRDYLGHEDQIGREESPDCGIAGSNHCGVCHVCVIRGVFGEVRRVLRDDGSLWLNYGDSYNANQGDGFNAHSKTRPHLSGEGVGQNRTSWLKPKDLVGIPWRVAFALQADGWWLRQDIIWSKPSPMPESVSDRCTKAHEYLFLLTKSPRYFYDAEAIKEKAIHGGEQLGLVRTKKRRAYANNAEPSGNEKPGANADIPLLRNRRSVWTLSSEPFAQAHFATFPTRLVEPCILAGTSERGCCPTCGAQWKRVTSRSKLKRARPNDLTKRQGQDGTGNFTPNTVAGVAVTTLGWEPTCSCDAGDPVPCTVFDPFLGSGTTAQVARHFGRHAIGCELNEEYAAMARRRIETQLGRKGAPLKTLVRIERALPEDGELPIVTETDSVAALKRLGFKDVRDQWSKGNSGSQPFCLVCYGPHPLQNVAARVVEIPPLSDPLWTGEALQKLASRLREGSADLDVVLTGPGEVRFRRLVPF